jgi:hypothetical protein
MFSLWEIQLEKTVNKLSFFPPYLPPFSNSAKHRVLELESWSALGAVLSCYDDNATVQEL